MEKTTKVYGPDPATSATPDVLAERLMKALEGKGVKFSPDARVEDCLQAAIDFITGGTGKESYARTAKPDRHAVIETARREHAQVSRVTSLEAFTNMALTENGHKPLDAEELLTLPGVR